MSDLNPTSVPFEAASPNDRGVSISVVNVILIIFSGIIVFARAVTRLRARFFALDNVAAFISFVFALAQSVCVQIARNNGLGKHRSKISSLQFEEYSRFNYTSQPLTIITLLFAKLAVSQVILTIKPKQPVRIACHAVDGSIITWSITSIFALAFQCDVPKPWLQASDRCVNLKALYYYVGILNILTDVALVILPVFVVWDIQLKKRKKLLVWSLFFTRIAVPVVVIAQLASLNPYLNSLRSISGDQTWENTIPILLNQIIVHVSLWAACVPGLRRVVIELQTKQTGLIIPEHLELSYYGKSTEHATKASETSSRGGETELGNSNSRVPYGRSLPNHMGNVTSVLRGHEREKERSSDSSQEHLRKQDNMPAMEAETCSTPSIGERTRDNI